MLVLDRSNITPYLKEKMPELDFSRPLDIAVIGEGRKETDGDSYLNYVFRVSDGNRKLVLKQSREQSRNASHVLPGDRVAREYESFRIRSAICPEYVPQVYFIDRDNNIMAEEDLSHLKIMRFQLNKNRIYPGFGRKVGEFLARTHFYTSEFYLDTETFRKAAVHFINHEMRNVFDEHAFVTKEGPEDPHGYMVDPELQQVAALFTKDSRIIKERFKLRKKYVGQGEALIHADIHTSNIFIDRQDMKVIDMEYTFCGPMAYDLGYLLGNIVSQYICAGIRPADSESDRRQFRQWCLDTMVEVYDEYTKVFRECWEKDVKSLYRRADGFLEDLEKQILADMIGFSASTNFYRSNGEAPLPEYDELGWGRERLRSLAVTALFDHRTLLNRHRYADAGKWALELKNVDETLSRNL